MADTTTPGAFIPHDTITRPRAQRGNGGGLTELLLLLSIVLLVASGALAVGVFLYGQYLQNQNTSKQAQLQTAEAAFDPSLIEQITRLDDRMHAASTILTNHLAPTAFFQALNQATLQTVSFQTLDLEAPDPQHITIKMQGVAQSVNSIALQADLFSQSGVITGPIFSNIARQADGVHFDLSATVNPSTLEYSALLQAASAAAAPAPTAPVQQAIPVTASSSPFNTPAPSASSSPAQGTPTH